MIDSGTLIKALTVLGGAGLLIAILFLVVRLRLSVRVDKREAAVRAVLPGANCGACGFPACKGYAAAVAAGKAPLNACVVRVPNVTRRIGDIMGQDVTATEPGIAFLVCRNGREQAASRPRRKGKADCRPAPGGPRTCSYGCVGLGQCAEICPFSAITMGGNGLPVIDERKCTGCGKCVKECPRQTLLLIRRSKLVVLACVSHDQGKAVKDVCRVGCIACDLCVRVCPVQALAMDDNLPVMDFEKCIDCGICVRKCPAGSFIDRAPGRPLAIINARCDGCQACVRACQFGAIQPRMEIPSPKSQIPNEEVRTPKPKVQVVADKCIGCGECHKACPVAAIDMVGALGHSAKAL